MALASPFVSSKTHNSSELPHKVKDRTSWPKTKDPLNVLRLSRLFSESLSPNTCEVVLLGEGVGCDAVLVLHPYRVKVANISRKRSNIGCFGRIEERCVSEYIFNLVSLENESTPFAMDLSVREV